MATSKPAAVPEPAAESDQRATALPLYHRVYANLRARIDSDWGPGDRMPTESELVDEFGVSLITIRRALDELVRERRIERVRGRGTFVAAPPLERELTELTSFTDEMRERGLTARTELRRAALAEAGPRVAEMLGLPPGAAVYAIERLRHVDGVPLLIEQVEIPAQLAPGLLDEDLADRSLYDVLDARYGQRLVGGTEALQPALPTAKEAELLEQDRAQPVLILELVSHTASGVALEYCRSVLRGDRARYRFEVNRQRPSLSLVTDTSPHDPSASTQENR